jgi:hypothetical protein
MDVDINKPVSPSSINVHDVPYNILKFHFHNFDHCFPEFVFILKYQRPLLPKSERVMNVD